MTRFLVEVPTLVGPIRLIWDDEALGVDASGRTCVGAVVRSEIGRGLREAGAVRTAMDAAEGDLALVVGALRAWSDGTDLDALGSVPVLQAGGEFRQRCWHALRAVKAGAVVSYAELAALAGSPSASRAAGSAMATNTLAPFVPCHRVVRADGVIGNYSAAGGSATKARMLEHEGLEVG